MIDNFWHCVMRLSHWEIYITFPTGIPNPTNSAAQTNPQNTDCHTAHTVQFDLSSFYVNGHLVWSVPSPVPASLGPPSPWIVRSGKRLRKNCMRTPDLSTKETAVISLLSIQKYCQLFQSIKFTIILFIFCGWPDSEYAGF